jgi:hypothetical protein
MCFTISPGDLMLCLIRGITQWSKGSSSHSRHVHFLVLPVFKETWIWQQLQTANHICFGHAFQNNAGQPQSLMQSTWFVPSSLFNISEKLSFMKAFFRQRLTKCNLLLSQVKRPSITTSDSDGESKRKEQFLTTGKHSVLQDEKSCVEDTSFRYAVLYWVCHTCSDSD